MAEFTPCEISFNGQVFYGGIFFTYYIHTYLLNIIDVISTISLCNSVGNITRGEVIVIYFLIIKQMKVEVFFL